MSFRKFRRGLLPNPRSDLFSLGALLYELATALRPSVACGESADQTAPPSNIRPDLPSSFDALIGQLLSESPVQRPSSSELVMRQLHEIARTSNLEAIIAQGESDRVEFKWSLCYPRELHRKDIPGGATPDQISRAEWHAAALRKQPLLQKEVASTIAAFLNTSGGTLLIGVSDDGAVTGIEHDYPALPERRRSLDGWSLTLKDAVQSLLGKDVWGSLHVSLVRRDAGTVAVVSCASRTTETWLIQKDTTAEVFYVRTSASTEPLSPRNAANYIREHWPQPL